MRFSSNKTSTSSTSEEVFFIKFSLFIYTEAIANSTRKAPFHGMLKYKQLRKTNKKNESTPTRTAPFHIFDRFKQQNKHQKFHRIGNGNLFD
jgi:hypothetical protein